MTGSGTEHPARLARVGVVALAVLVANACGPLPMSPAPTPSPSHTLEPSPNVTPRPSPTPVPTPVATTAPSPSPSPPDRATDLLIRVSACIELCLPTPGTTVLADGRIIWEGPAERALEARLTPAALAQVRDEIRAHEELASAGEYRAQLRPGAEPFPRGITLYRFEVGDEDPHVVISGEPNDFALEPELWVIPPAMERLARLARQLLEPLAWLGPEALAGAAGPHQPTRYLVLVELFPGVGAMPEFRVDIDRVASPFGVPFEGLGEPVQVDEGGFPVRCLVTDAETAAQLAEAEAQAGVPRDIQAWSSAVPYRWERGQGFVQVTLRQVLPHQEQPCAELELDGFAGAD